MYFIYAIYNQKNNKIYVGQTKNLQERLDLHNKKFLIIVIHQDMKENGF